MSRIDDAFDQERSDSDLKLEQQPNWNGTVYGACQSRGCGNEHKVAFYEGGFCKLCSERHPDDRRKYVLASYVGGDGYDTTIPNPQIRWITKRWVKDLSKKMSFTERQMFYETPEQLRRRLDRVDYEEQFDPDEDIVEPTRTPKKEKTEVEDDDWVE